MENKIKVIRFWLVLFMVILFISGITAIPIDIELKFLMRLIPLNTGIYNWLHKILSAYTDVHEAYPFLFYGYDWLAFAHIIIAILFIGPYKDPVKNIWVIKFGMIACTLVVPMALIAGYFRSIPISWRLIDCSFGVFGFIPLGICYKKIRELIPYKK